jgi:autotransporter-associated beta strand protein
VGNFITVSPSVPTSQLINAQLVGQGSGIDVANDRRAAGQSLTLAGPISAGATWFVTGPGHTVISGSVSTPASAISGGITHDGLGPLTLGGAPKTVSAFTSGGNLEIDAPLTASRSVRLAGDVYLNDQLTLAGATLAASGVVHGGPSGILTTAFSAGGYSAAYPAQTLTLDCPISGGSFYFGLTAAAPVPPGGTVVLTRANAYTGSTTIGAGVVSVSSIGDSGVAGNLGSGSTIQFGSAIASGEAVLRYTGSGESSNRAIVVGSSVGGPPVIEQAGTGLLKLTGSVSVT